MFLLLAACAEKSCPSGYVMDVASGLCLEVSDTDTDTDTDVDYVVCDDGVAPYNDIQDAVDDADPGDVITICPGRYTEVEIDRYDLSLDGELDVTDTWIVDNTGTYARAVEVSGGDLILEDVRFERNVLGHLVYVHDSGSATIRHAVMTGNEIVQAIVTSSAVEASNNLIYGNSLSNALINLANGAPGQWVWNNTLWGNTGTCTDSYPPACPAITAEGGTIENNIFAENTKGGAYIRYPDSTTFQYNDTCPDRTTSGCRRTPI